MTACKEGSCILDVLCNGVWGGGGYNLLYNNNKVKCNTLKLEGSSIWFLPLTEFLFFPTSVRFQIFKTWNIAYISLTFALGMWFIPKAKDAVGITGLGCAGFWSISLLKEGVVEKTNLNVGFLQSGNLVLGWLHLRKNCTKFFLHHNV